MAVGVWSSPSARRSVERARSASRAAVRDAARQLGVGERTLWPQHDQRSIEVYRRGAWLCTAIPHNAFALVLVGGNGTWRVLSAALLLGPVAHGLSSGLL